MLKKWTTHSEYLSHLNREIDSLSPHEKNRLFKLHQNSLLKLSLLNLDPLLSVVKPLYPELGDPTKNQCEIIRSLILMVDARKQSITDWALDTTHAPILRILCEFHENHVPGIASNYNLLARLWLTSRKPGKLKVRKF